MGEHINQISAEFRRVVLQRNMPIWIQIVVVVAALGSLRADWLKRM